MTHNTSIDAFLLEELIDTADPDYGSSSRRRYIENRRPRTFLLSGGSDLTKMATVVVAESFERAKPRTLFLENENRKLDPDEIAALESFDVEPGCAVEPEELLRVAVQLLPLKWPLKRMPPLRLLEYKATSTSSLIKQLGAGWEFLDPEGLPLNGLPSDNLRNLVWALFPYDWGLQEFSSPELADEPTRLSAPEYSPEEVAKLVTLFRELPDPQRKRSSRYQFTSMLALLWLARYAGAETALECREWGESVDASFHKALGFPQTTDGYDLPSEGTIQRFINTCRKRRSDFPPDEYVSRFGRNKPGDGGGHVTVLPDARVLCILSDWLETVGLERRPHEMRCRDAQPTKGRGKPPISKTAPVSVGAAGTSQSTPKEEYSLNLGPGKLYVREQPNHSQGEGTTLLRQLRGEGSEAR